MTVLQICQEYTREVQAVIRQQVSEAVYCHCKAHSLNLAIGHACGGPLIRNMLRWMSQPQNQSYWQRAVYLPLIEHLIQEMNDRLLSQEDRFLTQYLLPTIVQGLGNDVQGKMYEMYSSDLTDKRECEMLRWKTKWLHSTRERPTTLAGNLDCINPTLYRNVNTDPSHDACVNCNSWAQF